MAARVSAPSRPPHANESREILPRRRGHHAEMLSFTFFPSRSHRTLPPTRDQNHGLVGHQELIAFTPHL